MKDKSNFCLVSIRDLNTIQIPIEVITVKTINPPLEVVSLVMSAVNMLRNSPPTNIGYAFFLIDSKKQIIAIIEKDSL
ncbi:hypothetical protein OB69_18030 [Roseivirga seohaensis subsp. aquiponti]|uniref:Uncharacterized protein n=1 Tax=Roseivirga seohaensis subsp. aquiponti TaxID=1566026 RepID=A0A0L8AGH7_9BACT|nr:hypothetical protein OB69_18030 [Roseivirga seohaensis subsp. aquiponti]